MKRSRAELAGRAMGRALLEMVNLMYQTNTARNFLVGLVGTLSMHESPSASRKEQAQCHNE
jgi:hypothetical protein